MEGVEGERNEIVAGTGDETEWIFAENPTGTKNVVGPEIIAPLPANNAAGRLLFLPSHLCTVYTRLPRERRTLEILDLRPTNRKQIRYDPNSPVSTTRNHTTHSSGKSFFIRVKRNSQSRQRMDDTFQFLTGEEEGGESGTRVNCS